MPITPITDNETTPSNVGRHDSKLGEKLNFSHLVKTGGDLESNNDIFETISNISSDDIKILDKNDIKIEFETRTNVHPQSKDIFKHLINSNRKGQTTFHIEVLKIQEHDHIQKILHGIFSEHKFTLLNKCDNEGQTPLHYIISKSFEDKNYLNIIDSMLQDLSEEQKFKIITKKDKLGYSPLDYAGLNLDSDTINKLTKEQDTDKIAPYKEKSLSIVDKKTKSIIQDCREKYLQTPYFYDETLKKATGKDYEHLSYYKILKNDIKRRFQNEKPKLHPLIRNHIISSPLTTNTGIINMDKLPSFSKKERPVLPEWNDEYLKAQEQYYKVSQELDYINERINNETELFKIPEQYIENQKDAKSSPKYGAPNIFRLPQGSAAGYGEAFYEWDKAILPYVTFFPGDSYKHKDKQYRAHEVVDFAHISHLNLSKKQIDLIKKVINGERIDEDQASMSTFYAEFQFHSNFPVLYAKSLNMSKEFFDKTEIKDILENITKNKIEIFSFTEKNNKLPPFEKIKQAIGVKLNKKETKEKKFIELNISDFQDKSEEEKKKILEEVFKIFQEAFEYRKSISFSYDKEKDIKSDILQKKKDKSKK